MQCTKPGTAHGQWRVTSLLGFLGTHPCGHVFVTPVAGKTLWTRPVRCQPRVGRSANSTYGCAGFDPRGRAMDTLDEIDWDRLLKRIKDKRCTPVVGAGASASFLPVGSQIAKEWAEATNYPLPDVTDL